MKLIFTHIVIIMMTTSLSSQQTMGLFFNDEKSENGYTLFSNNESTYLIDNCGFKVNEWESEYKTNNGLLISKDGDLFRQAKFPGTLNLGGTGGIIEQFSWEGDLLWSFNIADDQFVCHHDMLQLPNGNLIVIVWETISASQATQEGRTLPGVFYNEQIWEIRPLPNDGVEIVWKWSALDHVIQDQNSSKSNFGNVSQHPERIDINYITDDVEENSDWLHVNSIDYNEAYDQLIFSSRNTSEVYVIDHSTSIEEAAGHSGGIYGKGGDILYRYGNPEAYDHGNENDRMLHQPHDVRWIPHGEHVNQFIIFNNLYQYNTRSRIQIWNNPSIEGTYSFSEASLFGDDELIWTYDTLGFYSSRMSSAQILPNGNILTTEGTSGEISEITPSKEKVWKYINPVNKNGGPGIQGGSTQFNSLFKSVRYSDDDIGFDNVDIESSEPVEILPDDSDCQIYISTSAPKLETDKINYRISSQFILFENLQSTEEVFIYDVMGRLCSHSVVSSVNTEINITSLPPGVYILKTTVANSSLFYKN